MSQVTQQSNGGQFYTTAAAATLASVVAPSGLICKIHVLTSGTAATSFYDNSSAISGTVAFIIPANPTVGAIYDVQIPVTNGLSWGTTNTSQVVVTYSKSGVGGNA